MLNFIHNFNDSFVEGLLPNTFFEVLRNSNSANHTISSIIDELTEVPISVVKVLPLVHIKLRCNGIT